MQLQMGLEQVECHLHIPTSCIEAGDLRDGQLVGIQDIGDVAEELVAHSKLDEPSGMGGPVGTISTELDELVEGLALLVEGVEDLEARLGAHSGEPEVPLFRQSVEPGEREVAEVRNHQRAGPEGGEQIPGCDL